jgi:hypothetical protein
MIAKYCTVRLTTRQIAQHLPGLNLLITRQELHNLPVSSGNYLNAYAAVLLFR